VDAGFRKPAPEFFDFALCALSKDEVLFVGNQLNTDITGGEQYGIRTVWLCGRPYRSADETQSPKDVRPTYTIRTFRQLPILLQAELVIFLFDTVHCAGLVPLPEKK